MKERFREWFLWSVGVIFFIAAVARLANTFGAGTILQRDNPLFPLTNRSVSASIGTVELAFSGFLLSSRNRRLQLLLTAWITTILALYRVGLWWINASDVCYCIGLVIDLTPVSPRTISSITFAALASMLVGSCALLRVDSRTGKRPASAGVAAIEAVFAPSGFRRLLLGWGIGSMLFSCLFVVGRLQTWIILPKHFHEMLEEISSVGTIRYAPIVNAGRTKLLYARNVENGLGIFQVDLGTLQRRQLELVTAAVADDANCLFLMGWSPDDRYLAYSLAYKSDSPGQRIALCDGSSGRPIEFFELPTSIRQAVWLTTNSLAILDAPHHLYVLNLETEPILGQFGKRGLARVRLLGSDDSSYSFTRMSNSSIAYVSAGNIWSLDIATQQSRQLSHLTNSTLQWLDYSPTKGEFLVCLSSAEADQQLYRFNSNLGTNGGLMPLGGSLTFKGQWLEDGSGVTYVGTAGNRNFLAVSSTVALSVTNMFIGGHVRSYNLDPGRHTAYVVASAGEEPMGIWEYDIAAKALRNVVPGLEHPFAFSEIVVPTKETVIGRDSQPISYFILSPARFDKHKQYPAVIHTPQDSRWEAGHQILANAGIYFVAANQSGLKSSDILLNAGDDILAVYNELLKNPNVDRHRIYLAGESNGTTVLRELVVNHPGLWRGAVFLSPRTLTTIPKNVHGFPSIFVSIGDEENDPMQQAVNDLVQQACNDLVSIQVVHHQNAPHVFASQKLIKERYAPLAQFILSGR